MDSAPGAAVAGSSLAFQRFPRATLACAAGIVAPAAALALIALQFEILARVEAVPFVAIASVAATVFLLFTERERWVAVTIICVVSSLPALVCAAWLDGDGIERIFVSMINISIAALLAMTCARAAPGAAAGVLYCCIAALPPLFTVAMRVAVPRIPDAPAYYTISSFSPFFAAGAGEEMATFFCALFIAGFLIIVMTLAWIRESRDAR
ncbi:MAG: hypothetical protein ACKVS6_02640 [Planctomycetota bacterium]